MPKVSVVIATYNRAHFIKDAVNSILAQTFSDYEIVIVDDGSKDNTKEIVQGYGEKVRYFYQANQGKSAAQNYAVSQSRGEYIALLDDDDIWLPNKLEIQMKGLEENPELGFVCSESDLIDEKGEFIRRWKRKPSNQETFASLYEENFIQHSSVVVRKELLNVVGGLDVALKTTEDYDLWLRLAKVCRFRYIDKSLVIYRQHAASKHLNTTQKLKDRVRVVSKPENMTHIGFVQKKIRISREYCIHAQYFQDYGKFGMASKNYFKALFYYPLIGLLYAQQGATKFQSSVFYRIIRIYLKAFCCLWKAWNGQGKISKQPESEKKICK